MEIIYKNQMELVDLKEIQHLKMNNSMGVTKKKFSLGRKDEYSNINYTN